MSLGAAFSLTGSPAALAACTAAGANPVVVSCDDTTTDNTDNPPNNVDARNQVHNDNIDAEVQAGATVDGYGLRIETTLAGGTIEMDHLGTLVELSEGPPTADSPSAFGPGALELNGNGGLVTYTGDGDVSNLTDTGAGLLITNTGDGSVDAVVSGTITGPAGIVVTVEDNGTIDLTTNGLIVGTDGHGIHTLAEDGNTTITADDDVTATDDGIHARSTSGNIGISGAGDITGDSDEDGTGNGIDAASTDGGSIVVDVTGAVTGDTGILVSVVDAGTVEVTTGGPVEGTGGDGINTAAIDGNTTIIANDDVTGFEDAIDATATGTGGVSITTAADTTVAAGVDGITAQTTTGNVTIVADGDVEVDRHGVFARTTSGSIDISGTGDITGDITGVGTGNGIDAASTDGGSIVVDVTGAVTGDTGILVSVVDAGTVEVTTGGPVEGTGDAGISTAAVDGNTTIIANDAVTGADHGIHAVATAGGGISVTTNSAVDGTAGDGVLTSAVNGDTVITANAARVRGANFGANAASTGTGSITVTGAGNYRGGAQAGISAVMTGSGPVAGTDGIVISGTGRTVSEADTAIVADIQNGANDSDILITRSGVINGATGGIDASTDGGGDIVISGIGPVTTTTGTGVSAAASGGDIDVSTNNAVSGETGIAATVIGAGTIDVTTGGAVDGTVDDGINTLAVNGDTTVITNGEVTGADDGIDATATGAGDLRVGVAGGAEVTGLAGAGVSTDTATGAATIDNDGLIQGAFSAISGATSTMLDVVNQAGGLIQNLSADIADLAISVTGTGDADIDNDGTIRGRLELSSGDDMLANSGLWATTGVSDFGAGSDSVFNTGRVRVAEQAAVAEITHFDNLEFFTNASTGVIDMVDDNAPNVGDQLTIDGLYTGVAGSVIEMDLALVSGNPQAGSDLLVLDAANPAQGTSDLVFNIVSTGVTATTADGNRVAFTGGQLLAAPVTVVENRGNLTTSSGDDEIPLARSGLITYDLVSSGSEYQVVSQLDGGLAGGLLLPIPATLATVAFTTQRTPNPITATCIDPDNKPTAQGGWARGMAGEFNTESSGSASNGGVTTGLESDNRTRFKTLQGGFDHVWCNLGSFASTFHLGVTVGQTWGDSVQKDPDPTAGVFGTDVSFDTFFVGPYAAMTSGNFAAQASLRFDYHSLELSNPTVGVDASGLDVDAEGISGAASMSYDFEVATLTVTPDVGVNVSNTEIDSFEIAGGTVVLDDLWSVMGHAGVTARTQPLGLADNLFVVPFASATLYHEFIEHADGQLELGGTDVDVESNRVGTFGQLGIGANAVRLGNVVAGRPTLFGGARFDLQVGERIEGATATVFGRVQF